MVGSNLVYFERQEEPRIRVATLICNLTRTFLVFKLETFSKIRSIQPVISTTHALIVAVHFFVVNSGPQYSDHVTKGDIRIQVICYFSQGSYGEQSARA